MTMNRRTFSTLLLTGTPLLGLAPLSAQAVTQCLAPAGADGWESAEQCRGLLGQRFIASGPAETEFELIDVVPYSDPSSRQFFARFQADRDLPEGIYLLRHQRDSKALFLQPVQGQIGVMEAAFSLRSI
jgi:hypothetical protein